MKKLLVLYCVFLFFIGVSIVFADGSVFIDNPYYSITLPSQKAIISWNGQTETLLLSTKVQIDEIGNIVWVVPVQSSTEPTVTEGEIQIFYDVADAFGYSYSPPIAFGGLASQSPEASVEVVSFQKVDIYDITVLKATDADALVSWLQKNGYVVPDNAASILDYYCQQKGFYFIANKINLANVYSEVVFTADDSDCAKTLVWYMEERGRGRTEQQLAYLWEYNKPPICEEADYDAVVALVQLSQGIATPIEITFQPDKPMFPLKMSSMIEGYTDIDVYFFADEPMSDATETLVVQQIIETDDYLRDAKGLNYTYVTYSAFSGNTSELHNDSVFEPTVFMGEEQEEYNDNSLYSALFFEILGYFIILGLFILFAVIGFIAVVIWTARQYDKSKKHGPRRKR